ncbi:hypothetical protein CCACVL1_09658 [Corchorus capsularis]|uniref:Uncharacterized protein n=1 Tax=Corchorus capsularis TaxID=210143 RepID=A0A1R3IUK1_COCAP|nr:hypothetical protein CCACVL1_09658 [Corchorus capsularis]
MEINKLGAPAEGNKAVDRLWLNAVTVAAATEDYVSTCW